MDSEDAVRLTDRLHAEQGKGDPFAAAVRATRMPMLITDPRQDDNPIVFANDAFLSLTGYLREEVMGSNCRFLQGPNTDRADVAKVREAIEQRTDVTVELLNYRKNGTEFWNALYISPVFGENDDLQFFFASQFDVTERKQRELEARQGADLLEAAVEKRTAELRQALEEKTVLLHEVDHRVKNNLQMVAGMLRNQAKAAPDLGTVEALLGAVRRVETLGTVHRAIYQSHDVRLVDVAGILKDIATSVVQAGSAGVLLVERLEPLLLPSAMASPIALLTNELLTNALKHAFPNSRQGMIYFEVGTIGGIPTLVVQDDGIGMRATRHDRQTFGSRLISTLVRQVGGELNISDMSPGTRFELRFRDSGSN